MSTVHAIRTHFSDHVWKVKFADALIALRPDMSPDAADEVFDEALIQCVQIDPVEAAWQWLSRNHEALIHASRGA